MDENLTLILLLLISFVIILFLTVYFTFKYIEKKKNHVLKNVLFQCL